ncbi:hypothetical protein [Sedimenticola selenatireducens]|uniref:Uncharacterized protein n=1 Tax=Sedimenticola selenatireducens TaxID=191960 RepID=A0A2N6CU10_9GAMM|nr:hypothetical protein [Sedimenticola selenatireducens]PLX60663.1 MAG: hypothetical protein C0630_14555 [Sedimenticola selenatireducens]
MPRRSAPRALRHQIAIEAAQLIAEQSDLSYAQARNKAAKRLRCTDQRQLPENREIELALKNHLQLFQPTAQATQLHELRKSAAEAMRLFSPYHPRLIGPVLTGVANQHTPVTLILFSDTVESVAIALMDWKIPCRQREVTLDYSNKKRVMRTVFSFHAGEHQIELLVLPESERHNLPLDPTEGRPQKGASLDQLLTLLASD